MALGNLESAENALYAGTEVWLEALDARNEMSHVYNQESFERVLRDVRGRYLQLLEDLHEMLLVEKMEWWEGQCRDADRA